MLTYKATTNPQKKIMPALLLHLKTAKATMYEYSAKKRQQLCGKKTNKTYSGEIHQKAPSLMKMQASISSEEGHQNTY